MTLKESILLVDLDGFLKIADVIDKFQDKHVIWVSVKEVFMLEHKVIIQNVFQ